MKTSQGLENFLIENFKDYFNSHKDFHVKITSIKTVKECEYLSKEKFKKHIKIIFNMNLGRMYTRDHFLKIYLDNNTYKIDTDKYWDCFDIFNNKETIKALVTTVEDFLRKKQDYKMTPKDWWYVIKNFLIVCAISVPFFFITIYLLKTCLK